MKIKLKTSLLKCKYYVVFPSLTSQPMLQYKRMESKLQISLALSANLMFKLTPLCKANSVLYNNKKRLSLLCVMHVGLYPYSCGANLDGAPACLNWIHFLYNVVLCRGVPLCSPLWSVINKVHNYYYFIYLSTIV